MAPDMNIAGQAQKLKKVSRLDWILEFDINYILNTVSIRYDSDKVTLAKIKKTIGTQVIPGSHKLAGFGVLQLGSIAMTVQL